ncbi:MAG: hypothetical protein P9C36_03605 [Defluviicoccus sp.]|nr:hypothetical protein [Defluviicoccus sp.]MDG4591695.1 hypothetical protein [Defluviicoccus sp.]MDG4601460.1 hypothetical protein [Defluviicoccus sp.]
MGIAHAQDGAAARIPLADFSQNALIGYSSNRNAVAGTPLAVGARSIAVGRDNVAVKANAVAIGKHQTVQNASEYRFGAASGYGMVTYVLAATTTDGSTVELTTDGTNFITIPARKVFCFEAFQTTWNRTDGAHQVCRFAGGVIKSSGGVVTLLKAPIV